MLEFLATPAAHPEADFFIRAVQDLEDEPGEGLEIDFNGHGRSVPVPVLPSGAHGLGERWTAALEPLDSRAE